MSTPLTIIQAEALKKSYPLGKEQVHALRSVSFDVQQGERLCIMGASGAGKSTLLHVLAGLDRPSAGTVHVDGRNVYTLSRSARTRLRSERIGFIFQAYHLLPELDVLDNVVLPAMSRRGFLKQRQQARERAAELLTQVGLEHRIQHRPNELSGGERQRVAIARSLMNQPDIILADEPTGNLDTKTGEVILEYIMKVVDEGQYTLLMVTHNQSFADRFDRKLSLKDGTII